MSKPLATIASVNACLELVLLDADLVESWEPLDEDSDGEDIGGHPQKVIELHEEDDDFVAGPLTVGSGAALVLTLEGATGEAEVRRLGDGTLALLEPPREWWDDADNFGKRKADVAALFEDALGPAPKAGKEKQVGKVSVRSTKLVVFDSNADMGGVAKAAKKATEGKVVPFGEDDAGVVLGLTAGEYVVARRVIEPKWADGSTLVVAYLRPA
ncbi:MAG: hypothetical protein KF764_13945 [Labilithrix sp.]|nr:hypothetical protein [Labilithrix sp.]